MPDIAMCSESSCPSAKICYRFTAKPSDRQVYADFRPDGDKCWAYIEAYSKSQIRRLESQTEGEEAMTDKAVEAFVHKVPCRCCDDRIASELKIRAEVLRLRKVARELIDAVKPFSYCDRSPRRTPCGDCIKCDALNLLARPEVRELGDGK